MAEDLRSFLKLIDKAGQLITIDKEVDPRKNLAGLAWQGENHLGKATYFNKLTGFPGWQAVSYAEASRKRLALAIGTDPKNFIPVFREILKKGPTPKKLQKTGPVKDIIQTGSEIDLNQIPIHIMSNLDAGPYMGSGMLVVKDPETGIQNVTLHRNQLKGKNKLGILMHPGRHTDLIYQKYQAKNQPMPVAIVVGHHALYYLASTWTFPFGVDEFEMAGTFLGEPVPVVKCETQNLEVPANAEIVIEGYIPPFEREEEGPFAEHTGYARAGSGKNPFIIVTAITRRKDAIYYALQGGKPIASSQILDALPQEVVIFERIKDVGGFVDLKDIVCLPCAGGSHIIVVQFTPKIQGEPKDVLMAALSTPYIHQKIAIAVDDDVDPHNEKELFWSLSTRVNPETDVFIIPGTHGHHLDASLPLLTKPGEYPQIRRGSVMGIDATKPPTNLPDARDFFTRSHPMGSDTFDIKDFIK
ncbi:MAG: UbiD family decarboxylase [Thermodesulfobacteriota bacterium]